MKSLKNSKLYTDGVNSSNGLYSQLNKNKKINSNIEFVKLDKNTYPSSTRIWRNSAYFFNKNNLILLPETSNKVLNLAKSYFNLFNTKLEENLRKLEIRTRTRKLSSNKIYVSNGVFKHTNNNVIIKLDIFNRQELSYVYLIEKKFNGVFERDFFNENFSKNLLKIKNFLVKADRNKEIFFKVLKNEINGNSSKLNEYNDILLKYYNKESQYKTIIRVYRKYKKYFLYKQLLFTNKSKFNYNYLNYFATLLSKVYNKNIQFDITSLKYFYLNSDIFTQSILLKIKRNRKKLMRSLKKLINKSKIIKARKYPNPDKIKQLMQTKNVSFNKDPLNKYITICTFKNRKTIKKTVIDNIRYKLVKGIRLEAKGRLTKRHTASRSVSKVRYKGNLLNLESSYLGFSTAFIRGNLRSSLQYSKLKSKTRIGSFGLKGWISGF